jgi:hypothetical protein
VQLFKAISHLSGTLSLASLSILRAMHVITRRLFGLILLVFALSALCGCGTSWKADVPDRPSTRSIVVDHQTDGTHRRLAVVDGVWYQTTGSDLLVLDTQGRLISRQALAPAGTALPASDIVVTSGEIAVLLGQSEVIVLDRTDPWRPTIVDQVDGAVLGMWPLHLGSDGDTILVFGKGSARTLSGEIVARSDGSEVTSVLNYRGRQLHVAGRRIHRRAGDTYLGTASLLEPAQPQANVPDAAFLFARNERNGALVGYLGENCRELDALSMTVGVAGQVIRLRQQGSRVLVVTSKGLYVLRITPDGLKKDWRWPTTALEDADWVDEKHLAIAGSFGRGVVPIGVGDPIENAVVWQASPAGLTHAASDGKGLRAHSPHGHWVYKIGSEPVLGDRPEEALSPPSRSAAVLGWSVELDDNGVAQLETPGGTHQLNAPGDGRFHCIAATEDAFWFGHDSGILLLTLQSVNGLNEAVESRRLNVLIDGPVICIEPLVLGGGVAYAAEHGGFGIVREEF